MSVKVVCRTLMKLTPGLNFINVLCTASTPADPKSVKDTNDLTVFFTLSGSTSTKAVRRMLMKLTPGLNFINILCTAFTLLDPQKHQKTLMSHDLTVFFTLSGSRVQKLHVEH